MELNGKYALTLDDATGKRTLAVVTFTDSKATEIEEAGKEAYPVPTERPGRGSGPPVVTPGEFTGMVFLPLTCVSNTPFFHFMSVDGGASAVLAEATVGRAKGSLTKL